MPSIMLGAVGQGYEAAKGLVFDNRVTQALWGNYDSKAVDAYFFMYGAPLVQAISNAATYSKAALGAKLGELATRGEGYLYKSEGDRDVVRQSVIDRSSEELVVCYHQLLFFLWPDPTFIFPNTKDFKAFEEFMKTLKGVEK